MSTVQKIVAAWILAVAGFSLMVGAGYIARADADGTMRFGGADEAGNSPRENAGPKANSGEPRPKRDPIPEGESVWEDVPEDEITQKDRLDSRPGNFGTLETLFQFFDGYYAVEMEYRGLTFPFRQEFHAVKDGGTEKESRSVQELVFKTEEEFAERPWLNETKARESGEKLQNPMRSRNLFIEKIETVDMAADETNVDAAKTLGLSDRQVEVLEEIRTEHTEQAALFRMTMRVESLTSDFSKSSPSLVLLVRKTAGWRICWIAPVE